MGIPEGEKGERPEQAEAIGIMLADAFIARVERFTPATRRLLLLACRERLLRNSEIAKLLLEVH